MKPNCCYWLNKHSTLWFSIWCYAKLFCDPPINRENEREEEQARHAIVVLMTEPNMLLSVEVFSAPKITCLNPKRPGNVQLWNRPIYYLNAVSHTELRNAKPEPSLLLKSWDRAHAESRNVGPESDQWDTDPINVNTLGIPDNRTRPILDPVDKWVWVYILYGIRLLVDPWTPVVVGVDFFFLLFQRKTTRIQFAIIIILWRLSVKLTVSAEKNTCCASLIITMWCQFGLGLYCFAYHFDIKIEERVHIVWALKSHNFQFVWFSLLIFCLDYTRQDKQRCTGRISRSPPHVFFIYMPLRDFLPKCVLKTLYTYLFCSLISWCCATVMAGSKGRWLLIDSIL